MATTSTLLSTTQATAGSTWTNQANATGANNATFATFTTATNAAQGVISLTGYPAQSAVGGVQPTSIDSVAVTVYFNVATVARWTSVTAQMMSGGVTFGSAQTLTLSTTSSNSQTVTFTGVTYSQLATIGVRLTATKNGTQSSTFNVDAATMVITYTPVAISGADTATGTDGTGTIVVVTPKTGSDTGAGVDTTGTLTKTPIYENFESGSDGTTISTSNTMLDTVSVTGTGTAQFATAAAAGGSLGARLTATTSSTLALQWSTKIGHRGNLHPDLFSRVRYRISSYPSAQMVIARVFDGTSSNRGSVAMDTTGHILILDPSQAVVATSTTTVPTGQWFDIGWWISYDPTSGNYEVKIYLDPTSDTADETFSPGIAIYNTTGSAGLTSIRWGIITSLSSYVMDIDDMQAAVAGYPLAKPLSGGTTNVSGSDTGSGTDAGTLATTLTPPTDTGLGTDTGTLVGGTTNKSDGDTASGVDTGTLATALTPLGDTSSGVDNRTLAVALTPPGDTSLLADAGTLLASFSAGESGGSAEGPSSPLSATLTGADLSAAAGEAYQLSVTLQSAETGTGTDTGSTGTTTDKSGSDTATGTDAGTLSASSTRADTGSASDQATLVVSFTSPDLGSIVDTVQALATGILGSDTGTQVEGYSLAAGGNNTGSDTSSSVESGTLGVTLTGADTSTHTETGVLGAALTPTGDTGTAAEATTARAMTASEIVTAIENSSLVGNANLSSADTATAAEAIALTVTVSGTDLATTNEQGSLTLFKSGSDTSSMFDNATLVAQLTQAEIVAAAEVLAVLTGPKTWAFVSADLRIIPGTEANGSVSYTGNEADLKVAGNEGSSSTQTTEFSNGTTISINITW